MVYVKLSKISLRLSKLVPDNHKILQYRAVNCNLMTKWCNHELSLAYSKEQNAIVERANKKVMRHLAAIIFDRRVSDVWSSEYLPLVKRIINAKVHDTIGVSPAELVLGKSINLYTGLLLPVPLRSH
jgi:hypothetical protein